MRCWEEKEINWLREKATKKDAENRGSLLIQELGLLEFIEEHYLNQLVKGETRNDNTLDLVLTNSNHCRNVEIIQNVKLSDHNTIRINYAIIRPNRKEGTVTNHYTTDIQKYKIEKLTESDWENLNYNLLLEPWDKVNTMGAEELQNRITTNIENAIRKTAELKKKPKKPKPPLVVRKCLRTKRKISKRINNLNRNISYNKICKLKGL